MSVFVRQQKLRKGTLLRCGVCRRPWYLDELEQFVHIVEEDRVDLILRWSEAPIILSDEHSAALAAIGRTPEDSYGNGTRFHETPCTVVTQAGERFEQAIVSRQNHAPFERWRNCRLASEIASIEPSPHALSLAVRSATATAPEVRMGCAPTVVRLPGGKKFVLSGTTNFFRMDGYAARDVIVSREPFDHRTMTFLPAPAGVVFFVADWVGQPDVKFVEPQRETAPPRKQIEEKRSWLSGWRTILRSRW